MTTAKAKKPAPVVGAKKYKTAEGLAALPIYYKGAIIWIRHEPVEIDFEALGYEPKIQFQEALKLKHIIEIGD